MAQREPDGAPSLLFAGLRKLVMNGVDAAPAKAMLKALDPLSSRLFAGESFFVPATVQNTGAAGLANVELRLGNDVIQRSAWLNANETTRVSFANMRSAESGAIGLRLGDVAKSVTVQPKPAGRAVSAPYLSFQNLQGQVQQVDGGFYIREQGDFAVLDHGDQYGSAYLPQGLGATDTAIVRLENADFRSQLGGPRGHHGAQGHCQAGAIAGLPGAGRFPVERLLARMGFRWRRPHR